MAIRLLLNLAALLLTASPAAAQAAAPPDHSATGTRQHCARWVGEVTFSSRESGSASEMHATLKLRLREGARQERPGFTEIDLWVAEGTAEQSTVLDLGQGFLCSGAGQTSQFGQGRSGALYLSTSAEPVQIGMFSVPPRGGGYMIQVAPLGGFDLACGPTTVPGSFHPFSVPFSGATLPLDTGNQRMHGSDSRSFPTAGGIAHWSAAWDLRCECPSSDDAAEQLPILLGQVFEPDYAEISPEGEKSLEMVLPQMRCSPGRTRIRIVTGSTAETDELFLEALNRARRDVLKEWLRRHGVDPSQIGWSRSGGREDDVQVKFGQ